MDAHHFFALAESLAKEAKDNPSVPHHDALCRSAISRAYYSVFLLARGFIDELGIETRRIPSPHANIEQALWNSGSLTLLRLANTIRSLAIDRTDADYDLRPGIVDTILKVEAVIESARVAILQLDIIRAGRLTPPLDRDATAAAILKWAKENGKPLRKKASS